MSKSLNQIMSVLHQAYPGTLFTKDFEVLSLPRPCGPQDEQNKEYAALGRVERTAAVAAVVGTVSVRLYLPGRNGAWVRITQILGDTPAEGFGHNITHNSTQARVPHNDDYDLLWLVDVRPAPAIEGTSVMFVVAPSVTGTALRSEIETRVCKRLTVVLRDAKATQANLETLLAAWAG